MSDRSPSTHNSATPQGVALNRYRHVSAFQARSPRRWPMPPVLSSSLTHPWTYVLAFLRTDPSPPRGDSPTPARMSTRLRSSLRLPPRWQCKRAKCTFFSQQDTQSKSPTFQRTFRAYMKRRIIPLESGISTRA